MVNFLRRQGDLCYETPQSMRIVSNTLRSLVTVKKKTIAHYRLSTLRSATTPIPELPLGYTLHLDLKVRTTSTD